VSDPQPDSSNVEYYDQLADAYSLFFQDLDRNMEEEGDWLDRVLRPYGVQTVLDASCGTGRQAIPLAERGYQVTAVDPSAPMLSQAQAGARARGVSLSFQRAGFAQLPDHFGADYDAVIALGNGLCNQERVEDILLSLRSMRSCCRPAGICLVGVKDFDRIRAGGIGGPRFHGHTVLDRGGRRTILFEVWDVEGDLLQSTAFVVRGCADGRWETRAAQTREYMMCREELSRLAREAGFHGVERLDHPSEAVYALHL